jgi:hypothetical protein
MRTLALAVSMASTLLAMGAAGCSSASSNSLGGDDGGGPPPAEAGADAGADAPSDGTTGADTSTGSDASGNNDSSTGANDSGSATEDSGEVEDSGTVADTGSAQDSGTVVCGSSPTLHQDTAGDIFCDYGADGGVLDCVTGSKCCLGGDLGGGIYGPQACTAFGGTCTNGGHPDAGGSLAIPIECAQISDCTANGVTHAAACCLQGGATAPALDGCTYPRSDYGTAIACETGNSSPGTCAAGEVQICSSQADCPTGTTCTPGKWKILQLGFCL